jgi:hypothetical protein
VAVVADHVLLREVDNLISPRLRDGQGHVFACSALPNGLALLLLLLDRLGIQVRLG